MTDDVDGTGRMPNRLVLVPVWTHRLVAVHCEPPHAQALRRGQSPSSLPNGVSAFAAL
jgi:hypothetical protein